MKKTAIKIAALLCACAALLANAGALAQEWRLGDLIYVPAISSPGSAGAVSLTVEGLSLGADEDEPQSVSPLAGAEFGVYVYASDGRLVRWANPLFPSEPMRIRTGEGETLFTLPKDTEFYLKQESAPQGYLFDPDALIPVQGDAIAVRNATPGELLVLAQDELGMPLPGVTLSITCPDGEEISAVTDERGEAAIACDAGGAYAVREESCPQGVFAALSAGVKDARGVASQALSGGDALAQAEVALATRARVTFTHPAAGTVSLHATLAHIGDDAEIAQEPLPGVTLRLADEAGTAVVSGEDGRATLTLLSGTYDFTAEYAGDEDALLPVTAGQIVVYAGEDTPVELTAAQHTGRVAVQAQTARAVVGGGVTLKGEDGATYGPYAFDADGLAVSQPLAPGNYRIARIDAPQEMEAGEASAQGQSAQDATALTLAVSAGEVARVSVNMLTWETQALSLFALRLGDEAQAVYEPIARAMTLEIVNAQGETVGEVTAEDGVATIGVVSGEYALRMPQREAQALGVCETSRSFAVPGGDESAVFPENAARLTLCGVDDLGAAVGGAVYRVTDGAGRTLTVYADEDGVAVTPPLAPGEIDVTCEQSPEGHDVCEPEALWLDAGVASGVELSHPRYGEAELFVLRRGLDERGEETRAPIAGVPVRVYRVLDGGEGMEDTGVQLTTDENGRAVARLPQGEYVAQADVSAATPGALAPQALRFTTENMTRVSGEMLCPDALGGVRARLIGGELTDEQTAQVRFELSGPDGSAAELTPQDGAFYAGGLAAGTYVLRQTQIPQGYTLAAERTVAVSGGAVTEVEVPLEEYAILTVGKTGLTFNDDLQAFAVPLSGEYGVYTLQGGELRPYPSEGAQATVWANVTLETGKSASVKLPASVEGTTYYLREIGGAEGFTVDAEAHEVTLRAGDSVHIDCAVSSDRGFFSLTQADALGEAVAGGRFELIDAQGDTALSFTLTGEAYRNEMALPVGTYTLRQTGAAEGCALSAQPELEIEILPYLSQGGTVTEVAMPCARIPQDAALSLMGEMYAARETGLTMVTVDGGALARGETLRVPQMTVEVEAEGGVRTDIGSVVLSGATDAEGRAYAARIEYCLRAGGWQPSDARMTGALTAPTAVSLADVAEDISAVRVTYVDAQTGLEQAGDGFMPGQTSLNVRVGAQEGARVEARARIAGEFAYKTELSGETQRMARAQETALAFDAEGDGAFETLLPGRDGRIGGVAWLDEDADGLMDADESARYAGLTVLLLGEDGAAVETVRTDAQGRYAFDALPGGAYTVAFDQGDRVVFTQGEGYTEHIVSGVRSARDGASAPIRIDADHTDALVNAGCIEAASVSGRVIERTAEGEHGYAALNAELLPLTGGADAEPAVARTDADGAFRFARLLPGRYRLTLALPEDTLCGEAEDGRIVREIEVAQGDEATLSDVTVQRAAGVRGFVYIDDDGDGAIAEPAAPLANAEVTLLRAEDGHTDPVAKTRTGADGAYAFGGLTEGTYSVLFALPEGWAFTRFGADSLVAAAAGTTGSTDNFDLAIGQAAEDVNAGAAIPAQLAVGVFMDTQRDGTYNGNESMLPGVGIDLIALQGGGETVVASAETDESGAVIFALVSPGEYRIGYRMPGAWRSTVQAEPGEDPVSFVPQSAESAGESAAFTLSMGQNGVRYMIGAMLTGSVSGAVYDDDNGDARWDETEDACAGVNIELIDAEGTTVASRTSDDDGRYEFDGVAPGRYRVRFTGPDGSAFAATERSLARGAVQQSDIHVSETRTFSVSGGESLDTVDAGVVRLCSVMGAVFEDLDADGQWDDNESGLSGASVHLMNGAGRTLLASAETNELGEFAFVGQLPGDYVLRVDAPEGYVLSAASQDSAIPLDTVYERRAYTAAFTLAGGARVEGVACGAFRQGLIAGRVWQDVDYDGWMEDGEDGLREAEVALLDARGQEIAAQRTGRSGSFSFEALSPGEYGLRVELPEGYVYTAGGAGSRAPRQDEPTATLRLGLLEMGGRMDDVNVGALTPAKISGVAWLDEDDDGRRQSGDEAVAGVRVTLTQHTGSDAGRVMETVTDAEGIYRFEGVMPGDAQLTFELTDGQAFAKRVEGTRRVSVAPQADAIIAQSDAFAVTAGADIGPLDVGVVGVGTVSGAIFADAKYDGEWGSGEAGVVGATVSLLRQDGSVAAQADTDETGAFAIGFVRVGTYTVQVELPDGMIFTRAGDSLLSDLDVSSAQTEEFRLAMGEGREGMIFGAIAPASAVGRVTLDANEDGVPDAAEAGLPGAVVTALQGGTVVATARTDEQGAYALTTLRPGVTRVRVTLPEDALFSPGVPLTLAHADAQEGETAAFTLEMGETAQQPPVAAVRAAQIAGRVWRDEDADGAMGAQEGALAGASVSLLRLTDGGEPETVADAQPDADGYYVFPLLRSGVYAVRATLPEGWLFADCLDAEGGSRIPVVPGSVGDTEPIALAMGQTVENVHVGGILPGRLGDTVWLDDDGDGLQDYKEPLVPGVSLTLLRVLPDGSTEAAETAVSDEYGYYHFDALRPGRYILRLDDDRPLARRVGDPLGEIDSDLDPESARSDVIALRSGQTRLDVDVGLLE